MMTGVVAVTDIGWYRVLVASHDLDEVNFWRPGARRPQISEGTPWLFKLHAPENAIAGVGFFKYYTELPVGTAWDWFEGKNGARSLDEMTERLARYRRGEKVTIASSIGCVLLSDVALFERDEWVAPPEDWKPEIVSAKKYDFASGVGSRVWQQVEERLELRKPSWISNLTQPPAVGKPTLYVPRLGQGEFRAIVSDAYSRQCAISGERVFPALEAAHIKPFSEVKVHDVRNGILLRSDLHRLFDKGYVTIEPDLRFTVSSRVRDEFNNGRAYYGLDGRLSATPVDQRLAPDPENLEWHVSHVFLGR